LAKGAKTAVHTGGLDTWVGGLFLAPAGAYFSNFNLKSSKLKLLHVYKCSTSPVTIEKSKVVKKNGNICMTHKAFNGRVIVQYMAEACDIVISKQLPGNGRTIGVWLSQQVALGHRTWPYPADPEFGLASVCLKPGGSLYKLFGIIPF
jgi:hypothetical protein